MEPSLGFRGGSIVQLQAAIKPIERAVDRDIRSKPEWAPGALAALCSFTHRRNSR